MTRAALLYEEFQRVDEARGELYRILDRAEFDSSNPDAARKFAQFHLGMIALRELAFRKATLAFGQALQYDETFLDAQIGQADAYLGLALSDRPGEILKAAKRIEALASARIAFDRALTTIASRKRDLLKLVEDLEDKSVKSLEEGQVIQAVRRSRRSLQTRKASLHFRVARLESARQRDDAALEHYRIAANLDPDNKEYADARAFWEGIRRKAKEKQAARQSPKLPRAIPEK
jgi:tetratricopeptide (TPR) repeat protein